VYFLFDVAAAAAGCSTEVTKEAGIIEDIVVSLLLLLLLLPHAFQDYYLHSCFND